MYLAGKVRAMRKAQIALVFVPLFLGGCPAPEESAKQAPAGQETDTEKVPADLKPKIRDIKLGKGAPADPGDMCVVTYTGTLKDGKVFDSNADAVKPPFSFILGNGQVIAGWDRGIPGMRVGGERKLEIPAVLGYGKSGSGAIPPDADLIFDVKLLYVVKKGQEDVYDSTDLKVGTGKEAKAGSTVSVHYTGTLLNGLKFDSSHDRKTPFEFVLDSGAVIKGWDAGVKGMREGGKRKLVIPPALGYGDRAQGDKIPPNSVLVFEVELLKVK